MESTDNSRKPCNPGVSEPVKLSVEKGTIIKAVVYMKNDLDKYEFSDVVIQEYNIKGTPFICNDMTFSVEGGTYEEAQEVTLSCKPGSEIYYTTDGSDPWKIIYGIGQFPNGLGGSNPVTVTISDNCVLRAGVYKPGTSPGLGYFTSSASQEYKIKGSKVLLDGLLLFSPGPDAFQGPQDVTISAPAGWTICYTTDGSEPIDRRYQDPYPHGSGNSNPVTIPVSQSCRIIAVAYQNHPIDCSYLSSNISVQDYYIGPASTAVVFSQGGGTYIGTQEIVLSYNPDDPDWVICYTTDGSSPVYYNYNNLPSPLGLGFTNPVTVLLTESCTVRAVAFRFDSGDDDEEMYFTFTGIEEQDYYILEPDYSLSLYAPMFASVYEGYSPLEPEPLNVVSTGNSDATITSVALSGPDADCFTLNKTDGVMIPAGGIDSQTYFIGLCDGLACGTYTATVTAVYNDGQTASAEVTCTVNELNTVTAPFFSLPAGTYSAVQQVEIFCSTEDAFIYYTTDGTDPEPHENAVLYTGPIPVSADRTLKAVAVKPGMNRSPVTEASYTIELRLYYGMNDVYIAEELQPLTFLFAPENTDTYRFFCESGEITPFVTVYDGDVQISYQPASYQENNRIAELEGGKEYTVQVISVFGTGNATLMVNPTVLYDICADPAMEHGRITVGNGAIPANEGNTIGRAYAGAEVLFDVEPDEGYDVTSIRYVNEAGTVFARDTNLTMPWGKVTVYADFEMVRVLSYDGDEHSHFDWIWIDGGGVGAWGDPREVIRGQTVQLHWSCDEGYTADMFTVTTEGGDPVDWTFGFDPDNHRVIEFTMPGEDVYVALTSRGFSFDSADIILPADTQIIEERAFEGDVRITSVVIPAGCTGIGDMAFRNCTNLTYVRIPENCTMGEDVFDGCSQVYIYGKENSPAWQYCLDHEYNCVFVEE